jgi:hypothetical protein
MATENSVHEHAAQVAHVVSAICTRTLNHFAEEAKLNGESLKDAFERYEIDYAWHVLGSERMRNATVSSLEARHQQAATEEQKAWIAEILKSAAEAQAPELLMSFDNEVPEKLAHSLSVSWTAHQSGQTAAPAD